MKFNTVYVLLALLSMLSTVFCIIESDKQNLNECKKVCDDDLLPRLDAVVRNNSRTPEDFENLNFFWGVCQYKCGRCSLKDGIRGMDTMREMFRNNQYAGDFGLGSLSRGMNDLVYSLKLNCYIPWESAIKIEDVSTQF